MIKCALKALSDSDCASDKETRISVFGYIIYFCGVPVAWRSKGMKSVVLSTTEVEYMALSEVVKELKVIVQLLQTMNIEVELPITVHVDNVGAIWLSNNHSTSDRTKHIDIRTSFVKEYQEYGKIIIKFVKSEENEADIFTKNTVENSSSLFFQISCSQGILNSSRLSCFLLLRLLVHMYLSQLMRTFTNYLKCIVISS